MTSAYERKKQPELVRRALLDCAARLATEQGLAAVTIQAVADEAGVTKGGLFHHFQSKQALVEAMFTDLMERLDGAIDAHIEKESVAAGSFTRAYVNVLFEDGDWGFSSPWAALSVSMSAEPALRILWSKWINDRLERHHATDDTPLLEIVRLAADGAWLSYTGHDASMADTIRSVHRQLIVMTGPAFSLATSPT